MRKKLAINTFSTFCYQIVVVISGFILPRVIIEYYGSNVNGLVNSITQFISVISCLDLGVGAVVQANLYKPLVNKDNDEISKIYVSSNKFFKNIAIILIFYIIALVFIYPLFNSDYFSFYFIAGMIGILSIESFFQYYFGMPNKLMLIADHRGYVVYVIQTITIVLNTIFAILLIKSGKSIHIVKITTALIYLSRPIVWCLYVKLKYEINNKIKYDIEPIKQKWSGLSQHIAYIILDGTDIIVLTLFSTLENVSIYSVYYLVTYGIRQIIMSFANSLTPVLGKLWVSKDKDPLKIAFYWIERLIFTIAVIIFASTIHLIIPFIKIYTIGITDINYIFPLFGYILVIATLLTVLRFPYNSMILASGSFKETKISYIIAAVINIITSIVMVYFLGLIGVAIGTFIALLFQLMWQAIYVYKNLIKKSKRILIKHFYVIIISFILACFTSNFFILNELTYFSWFVLALQVFSMVTFTVFIVNIIFYKDDVLFVYNKIKNLIN